MARNAKYIIFIVFIKMLPKYQKHTKSYIKRKFKNFKKAKLSFHFLVRSLTQQPFNLRREGKTPTNAKQSLREQALSIWGWMGQFLVDCDCEVLTPGTIARPPLENFPSQNISTTFYHSPVPLSSLTISSIAFFGRPMREEWEDLCRDSIRIRFRTYSRIESNLFVVESSKQHQTKGGDATSKF